jgi:hypothetical protein
MGWTVCGSESDAGVEDGAHDVEVFFLNFYTSKVRRQDMLS